MKILFVTDAYPNYVPDLLLHGLRKLIGPDVVDYPRKDCLYEGVIGLGICPEDQRCPGWFPADNGQIDRTDIWRKIKGGHFDLVVCDLRAVGKIIEKLGQWPKVCAIIDGEDHPHKLPPGPYMVFRRETDGTDYSVPLPMALPEEVLHWIARYDNLSKNHTIGFLGSTEDGVRKKLVDKLSKYYPDSLFQATAVPSQSNPLPIGRLSRDGYYRSLQQCRVVLNLAGAGYDTFRFWENAACNALHATARMPLFIPDDFEEGKSIIRFETTDELRRAIDPLLVDDERRKEMICNMRLMLTQKHLTTHRAHYFIDRVRMQFG